MHAFRLVVFAAILTGCNATTTVEPASDASDDGGLSDAAVQHDTGDQTDARDAGACTGAFPSADAGPYAGIACDPVAAACPDGEYRANDYSCGPGLEAGCSCYPGIGNDDKCHRICRCDEDCSPAEPHCVDYPIFRGDDVAQLTTKLCRP